MSVTKEIGQRVFDSLHDVFGFFGVVSVMDKGRGRDGGLGGGTAVFAAGPPGALLDDASA